MIGTRLLNRYEVVSELGRGGMGVVYRARDPMLNRDVAVKLIPPSLFSVEAEERFQREAQLVAQMNHPSIVPIYDIGRHEGSLFFLMPVVSGRNLRRYLSEKARSVGDVVEIGVRVAEALEYSHARGVIHRDIKPENIMVSEDDGDLRVYVMDFGLAKATSENRLTKTGTLVGTVAYFSPEQVIAREIDHRSDIYSLGVVLYECLSGEPPFTGEIQSLLYRIVHEYPRSLRQAGVAIVQELDDIILSCIAKDPARRYERASELAAALRRCQSRLGDSEKSVVLSAVMTAQMQRPSLSELVDREKEFAELQRRLNAAIAGECQFAVIGGEPGIGKTRLVEELENLARARKIRVIHGRFVEQNRAFAYQAFADLIQDSFRARDAVSSSGSTPDFSDLAPELIEVFPALSEIAALRSSAGSSDRIDPQRRRDDRTYLYELLARTLLRIVSGKPIVIVLENLHAADASLEALQYAIQRLAAAPVLIVGTYRQTEIQKGDPLVRMLDSFAEDPRFASILLGPFTPSHHETFVSSVIGGREISQTLLHRIYKATEGNPFFTRELVRSLMESGGIVRDDSGTWTLSGEMAISSDALPATIQQAVEKRIERLPEGVRDVLALASVLGKSFDYEDLEAIVEDEKSIDKTVDRLVTDGLLEEERESRGDRLAFTSAIVRDVLYGSLSRRRRRSLHRRYAEYLEGRYAKRIETIYPQLVHHYSEGDVPEKTVEYGLKQARRALEAFSTDEAVQAIRTVLEFTSDEEWTGSRTAEGEARLLLAMAHRQQSTLDVALKEADAALRIFEREKELSRAADVAAFASDAAWQGRRIDDARRWIEEGIHLSRSVNRNDLLVTFLSLGATVSNLRGDYSEAKIYLDEAERLSGRATQESAAADAIPSGGTLRCPIANLVAVAEPALLNTDEDAEILALVFETLVNVDESGFLTPGVAHSWEVVDGGQSVRIVLDGSARFSDGSPVTAHDVKRSLERVVTARQNIPAVLEPVAGVDAFRSGEAKTLEGIGIVSERELVIRLVQPLAFYPAMLTDPTVAVAKLGEGEPLGSGHFRVAERTKGRTVLVRNENDWKSGSRIDRIEFEVAGDAQAIATSFRQGTIDIARDLSQRDLDELLRDSRLRPTYAEAPRKNTYFVLFNEHGPLAADPALRRALCSVLRVHELVWRSLGRLAQPAPSLVPPSIFGHDAGRRREVMSREEAGYIIEERRTALGRQSLQLTATMHPTFSDRYAPLAQAIADTWKDLGVEVNVVCRGTEEYLASFADNANIDVLLGRWNADYDDADNFTYGLFHSENGVFRRFFSTPATDAVLEQARTEQAASRRESLYRSFENTLVSSAVVVPLFHEINYRVARRHVRGLRLRSTRPYVNYAELGIAPEPEERHPSVSLRASELHVAILEDVRAVDPAMSYSLNEGEVVGNVFETLTRCGEGARIIPWLASEFRAEEGGQRYRFRLRDDVRFHDGRRLTARDVRFSWERRLASTVVSPHLAVIRGAKEFMRGEAKSVAGIHVVGTHEVVVDLEQPLAILPAVLSQVAAAIVPEGTGSLSGTWRDGCAGTGPFRVVDFQPGKVLELERNPDYWRPGLPKSDRLIFTFRTTAESVRDDFVNGRLSIVWDLSPEEIEELLHDRSLGAHHKSIPRLGCYMLALNRHSAAMGDRETRRRVVATVDVDGLVRRTLGRVATPATGVIPPGLLGYTGIRSGEMPARSSGSGPALKLRTAVHPLFLGQFRAFTDGLAAMLGQAGIEFEIANQTMHEFADLIRSAGADAVLGRWMADFPDADNFTHDVVHSAGSWVGTCVGMPELDELTERARRESDLNVRNALYRHIEDVIAREGLILPLFYQQAYHFVRPEIDGLAMSYTAPEVAYEQLFVRR